ncbi:MAG: SGNH/GDSL hydrolase family protein [Deltaproteobacteria bacterium]|nr:SGNH/GDSL hydrolase family protein [Deltaproteobacteria bacterium]
MRSIIFWGLFPFILPQAIYVRKTAPRFSAAAGPRKGTVGSGTNYNLIAIGDSIIAGVGTTTLAKALVGQTAEKLSFLLDCKITWEAIGSIGAVSNQIIEHLVPQLPEKQPDFMVVSAGVNDITSLSSVSRWRQNIARLLEALCSYAPAAIIAVAGIPPLRGFPILPQPMRALFGIRGETFDRIARDEISHHDNAIYVPLDFEPEPRMFSADGFHPSQESYQGFGEMMAKGIAEKFKALPSE